MRRGIALRGRAAAVLAASALSIGLCACGSSSTHSSSTPTAAASTARNVDPIEQARVRAASCMRSQGINIPDIGVGRGQVLQVLRIVATYPQAKVEAAVRACQSEIRQAFPNATSFSPQQQAQRRREAIVFAQCMRAHGVNFPDPTQAASNLSAYVNALSSLDVSSPTYKAAAAPCRSQALRAAGP